MIEVNDLSLDELVLREMIFLVENEDIISTYASGDDDNCVDSMLII